MKFTDYLGNPIAISASGGEIYRSNQGIWHIKEEGLPLSVQISDDEARNWLGKNQFYHLIKSYFSQLYI